MIHVYHVIVSIEEPLPVFGTVFHFTRLKVTVLLPLPIFYYNITDLIHSLKSIITGFHCLVTLYVSFFFERLVPLSTQVSILYPYPWVISDIMGTLSIL